MKSKCCKAKILMMFPSGTDNQNEKLPDRCSKCYKPIKIKEIKKEDK